MDYEMKKLKEEYSAFKSLWSKLKTEWEKPSDFEDLYKVYPYLTTTAAISRKYIYWHKELNFPVTVIIPSLADTVDTTEYLYYDEKRFFNGKKENMPMSQITSLFLHQREYCYMDNRKNDGKMSDDVMIYLYVRSNRLCKSCALVNNGRYKENGENFRKSKSFVRYSDCECGQYIHVESYLHALERIINKSS